MKKLKQVPKRDSRQSPFPGKLQNVAPRFTRRTKM